MVYRVEGFREFYRKFFMIKMNEDIRKRCLSYPDIELCDHVFTFGFIDENYEFCFEVLAAAKRKENLSFDIKMPDNHHRVTIKAEEVADMNLLWFDEIHSKYRQKFKEKMAYPDSLKGNNAQNNVRIESCLDPYREMFRPDVVNVTLERRGKYTEKVKAAVIAISEDRFIAKLIEEPAHYFGVHKDEKISFGLVNDKGTVSLLCDCTYPSYSRSELLDNRILRDALRQYKAENNAENLLDVLSLMRTSIVFVPFDQDLIFSSKEKENYLDVYTYYKKDHLTPVECLPLIERLKTQADFSGILVDDEVFISKNVFKVLLLAPSRVKEERSDLFYS